VSVIDKNTRKYQSLCKSKTNSSDRQKRFSKQNSFSFKTKLNDNNNHENTDSSTTIGRELLINNNCAMKHSDDVNDKLNEQVILEEIDVDVNELIDADELSTSIVYFPSSMSNTVVDTNT
jgi:hypothetical protein